MRTRLAPLPVHRIVVAAAKLQRDAPLATHALGRRSEGAPAQQALRRGQQNEKQTLLPVDGCKARPSMAMLAGP
jgi:hypothetical protein